MALFYRFTHIHDSVECEVEVFAESLDNIGHHFGMIMFRLEETFCTFWHLEDILSAWNSCTYFVTRGEIAAATQRLTRPRLRLPKRRMLKTQIELWGLGDPMISVLTHTSMWDHVGEALGHKVKGFWHTWDMFHLLLMDLDTIHDNWSRVVLGWKVLILRNII